VKEHNGEKEWGNVWTSERVRMFPGNHKTRPSLSPYEPELSPPEALVLSIVLAISPIENKYSTTRYNTVRMNPPIHSHPQILSFDYRG